MYRWREHTAEIELELESPTLEELFADALAGLAELLRSNGGEPARHEVAVEAADLPALLADWLNELVYLADVEAFVPERVVSFALEDMSLRATVEGQRGEPRRLVKAVTYHGLQVEQSGDVWRARVVLDV